MRAPFQCQGNRLCVMVGAIPTAIAASTLNAISLLDPSTFLHHPHKPIHLCESSVIMKFASLFSAVALLTAGASARSSARSVWSGLTSANQHALEEAFPVPGDNPLQFCVKPDNQILEIDTVDLSPNPPQAYVVALENQQSRWSVY